MHKTNSLCGVFPMHLKSPRRAVSKTAAPAKTFLYLFLFAASLFSTFCSTAQITFTAGSLTQTQNFDGMTGTALPTGFAITSKSAGPTSVDLTTTSLASNGTGGSYKFMSGTDYAIGFLNSGSYTSPENITATLLNSTGSTITGLTITFNYEKYRSGMRQWDWTFLSSTNGSSFSSVPAGNQTYAADAANTTSIFPPQSVSKSVTITGLSIAAGSSYYLRWILTGNGGSSNGQGLGIDDVSITATVQAVATCNAPAGLAANNITSTSADLSWTAVSGSTGYQYVVDQNAGNPAGAGTATALTGVTSSSLTPGTTYYLHVRNNCGSGTFSSWTTIPFTTLAACTPPPANITAAGPVTFCQNDSVVLNANTGTGLSYQWQLNGTNINGATGTSFTAHNAGSYTVIVSAACSDTSAATVVTVNALPTATITPAGATTFCTGGSVVLNAPTGTGLTYQWRLNGSNIASATSNSYTAGASGSYKVVVTNGSSCSDSSIATTITVNALPTATITPVGATTFCTGGSVVLNAPTSTGLTYQWRMNGSNIASATNNSYTANASGSYKVVVTNASSCSDSSIATTVTVNAPPTATITPTGPTTFCSGSSVVLNAPTGTGLTYQWRLDGSNITGATNGSYTANASGSYKVVVTNASSCSDSSVATTVTVNALPTATITPVGATTFCTGGSVVLNAPTSTGLTYQWRMNGSNIASATNNSYTANASGDYKVVVTNGSSCSDSSVATTVTVNALPTATITPAGATTFCTGGSVILNAPTGTGLTYQWRLNGSNIANATNSSYTANASGSYKVVVTNASSCSDSSVATTVTVNALPTATITAVGPTSFCTGGSVVLNAPTGTGLVYQWRLNGNDIAAATNGSYTASTSGNYKVVVTNSNGCSDSSVATTVTASALPAATITPAGPTTFCSGSNVVLNATTGTGFTYQWYQSGGSITGATNASYTATTDGAYTVKIINGNGCENTSAPIQLTENQVPPVYLAALGSTTLCAQDSVILAANTAPGYTYVWYRNGIVIPGATSENYYTGTAGSYTVDISNGGCVAHSSNLDIIVNQIATPIITQQGGVLSTSPAYSTYQWKISNLTIPGATSNTYMPQQTGFYTVTVTDANGCTTTSAINNVTSLAVQEITNNVDIRLYPNPASTVVHIDAPQPVRIMINSAEGKVVLQQEASSDINISNLAPGIYIVRIMSMDGNLLTTRKLLKTGE